MSTDPVVVVGAGPAGALLAMLLAQRGVRTTLIERQSDFSREFRGEVLTPGGRSMLLQAGVDLACIPHRVPRRIELFRARRRVFDRTFDQPPERMPQAISQPELLEHLVGLASAEPHFELMRGSSVIGVEQTNGRVTGLRTRNADGERHVPAGFVVGADGRGSAVRRRLEFEVIRQEPPMDVVWFKLAWPMAWKEARGRVYLGDGHLLLALPAADDRLQIAWIILKGTYGELRARGVDGWVAEMQAHVDPELARHIAEHAGELAHPFLLRAEVDRVRRWTRPGVLLIGDAAHTMSPVGAQGLNLAMRDAVVAANHLVPALRDGGDVDAAAQAVQREREPEIELIQRVAAIPPRAVLGRGRLAAAARWLATAMLGLPFGPWLAGRGARVMLDGASEVRLEV